MEVTGDDDGVQRCDSDAVATRAHRPATNMWIYNNGNHLRTTRGGSNATEQNSLSYKGGSRRRAAWQSLNNNLPYIIIPKHYSRILKAAVVWREERLLIATEIWAATRRNCACAAVRGAWGGGAGRAVVDL